MLTFVELIRKFNPYHDSRGRFSSSHGATSMTFRTDYGPGQKAIANLKENGGAKAVGRSGHRDEDGDKISETVKQAIVQEELGCTAAEAKEYQSVLDNWNIEGGEYKFAQSSPSKKGGNYAEDGTFGQGAQVIERYIERAPAFKQEMYRTLNVDKATAKNIVAQAKDGNQKAFNYDGSITSWTSKKDVADWYNDAYGEDTTVIFHAKNGNTKATSVSHFAGGKQYSEVIASKNAKWKYISHTSKKGVITIDVEEMP